MNRPTALALGAVVLGAGAVAATALRLIAADTAALHEKFSAERASQVDHAAELSRRDLDGVAVLLHLAGGLMRGSVQPQVRQRELEALLAANPQFRALRVFGPSGETLFSVVNPRPDTWERDGGIENEMRIASLRSMSEAGELHLSQPLPIGGDRSVRVYALALEEGLDGRPGAVAVLVDSARLLSKLVVLASEPAAHVLLLGPHGLPTPSSDPLLAAATQRPDTRAALGELLEAMRTGRHGTRWLSAADAALLGLGDADALAAYAPVDTERVGRWSLAVFTSTTGLRATQRSLVRRLGLAAGVVAALLLAFAAFAVAGARRAAVTQERLRHAERLAHLHALTETTLDSIPTGVLRLSTHNHVTAANRPMRRHMPHETRLPCALAQALPRAPGSSVARLTALVDAATRSGAVQSVHGETLALFGAEAQYSLYAVPLGAADDEARALLVIEDVTQVRSLESQLLRAEKLATLGVLAAGLAHEVGTPLGIVRSRAELVRDKLGHDHPQAHGLTVVIEQIDRVTRTLRQMLDFSRVQPASVRPVALSQVAVWLQDVLHFEAQRRRLTFEIDAPASLPPVAADPDQLQQVLLNLVMNACDACAEGGHVRFSAALATQRGGFGCVQLDVCDNGCGIPEKHRQGIFDPFFTTKKRGHGTGLGLTVAAQIVRNHGAQLELSSVVGRGTRVSVLWPLAAQDLEGAAE